MSNYTNVRGLQWMVWDGGAETMEPSIRDGALKIEEFYFDEHQGELCLTFETAKRWTTWERHLQEGGHMTIDRVEEVDERDLHVVEIPVKADRDWNGFVDSLPKWEQ